MPYSYAAVPDHQRSGLCRAILEALPAWFGIEAAREVYIAEVAELAMVAAYDGERPVGFATLKPQTPAAAELHLIGVLESHHRCGIGAQLLRRIEALARAQGARFLTVKTLAPSHADPGYAATRAFYERQGFLPIEVFPLLWGKENPCLLMAKPLLWRAPGPG
ncbi:MAG TPA: GNAT family N-acetyltransferase [Kiloniellales bacterium]|nr:GNAT family N-acetyltransferase [Kiloniellales bacterium]